MVKAQMRGQYLLLIAWDQQKLWILFQTSGSSKEKKEYNQY